MMKISNLFHQGTLTRIYIWGGGGEGGVIKVLWQGQGCLRDRCKGSENYKEIKENIKQMGSFSFLTETPFGKLK